MHIHLAKLSRLNISRFSHRVGSETRAFQAAPQTPPAHILHVMSWQPDQATFQGGPECRTDTTVKAGTILYIECHTCKQISWLNTCETCNIDSNYACTTIYKMSEIVGGDK